MRVVTPLLAVGAIATTALAHSDVVGSNTARADVSDSAPLAFTKTETIARTNLVMNGNPLTNDANGGSLPPGTLCNQPSGCEEQIDHRTVSLSVDVTGGLQTYQQLTVTWSGAHPTNFINSDPNTDVAGAAEEYPMVLMECRGVDDSTVATAQQISRKTCWTEYDGERVNLSTATAFPPWRLDRYADAADRAALVNQPNPLPTPCFGSSAWTAAYTVPLVGADGTTYNQYACNGMRAPEQLSRVGTNTQGVPDNTTFGVTQPDGTGSAKFDVWTDQTNATLGCSSTVACSLVAVPIMGISCDETASGPSAGDIASCEYQDSQSGAVADSGSGHAKSFSVEGDAWWSASNWDDRISVPLNFAPPANYCSIVSSKQPVLVYGSELMTEAAQQWAPPFCTDANRLPFSHIAESEPAAVNTLVAGTTEAAFDTYPMTQGGVPIGAASGSGPPIVNAPVAVSGFGIATLVDDPAGREVTDVRLDPRLLAKLLSESYPINGDIAQGDGGTWTAETDPATGVSKQVLTAPGPMVNNPYDVLHDPEFVALNPELTPPAQTPSEIAAAELVALSSNSDVMRALTSYIYADPAARAFLTGQPDPWGMVVNPAYKGISIPTDFWPLNDSFVYRGLAAGNPCWAQPSVQVPFMPLVAAPLLYLRSVTQDLEFGLPNSTTNCVLQQDGTSLLTANTRQQPGQRFLLGLVSLPEAHLYGLDTAELETQSTVLPDQKITGSDASDQGKFSFAAASVDTMKAAASQLSADSGSGAWTLDYVKLRTTSAGRNAYPGTMLISMSVPTLGLPSGDAAAYGGLLMFAAGDGQTPGVSLGQLPAGYLPMTAANGMSQLIDYTKRAAKAVVDQTCELPDLTDSGQATPSNPSCPSPSPSPSPSPTPSPTLSAEPPPAASTTATGSSTLAAGAARHQPSAKPQLPPGTSSQSAPPSGLAPPTAGPTPVSSPSIIPAAATPSSPVGPVGGLVPLLLLLGAVGGTGSLVIRAIADARARGGLQASR